MSLNAEIVLRKTLPARETGLPRIAAPGVHAVDRQPGFFESHAHVISPAPDSTSRRHHIQQRRRKAVNLFIMPVERVPEIHIKRQIAAHPVVHIKPGIDEAGIQ